MVRPPYAAVLRLYFIAADRWAEIDAAYPSADLIRFPTHRFLNFVYAWCVSRIEPDRRQQWEAELTAPLDPNAEPTPRQIEDEGQGFMNLLGMVQTGEVGHASTG